MTPAPGVGKRAEAGYIFCIPLINALDAFHSDSSYYPEDLYSLVPQYIEQLPRIRNNYRLIYDLPDSISTYVLQFRYFGPGTNICNYNPKDKWKCYGYY